MQPSDSRSLAAESSSLLVGWLQRAAARRGARDIAGETTTHQLARHWNVTVFVPLPFETMFETTCDDPLFMQ